MVEAGPEDASCVDDGGGDDLKAFEALYRQYEGAVYRTALALLRDEMTAEEVVVDTFLRAHGAWRRLDPDRSPLPWLQRVAVNLALNHLRRRRLGLERIPDQDPWPDERGVAPDLAAEQREMTAALARGIERLPAQMRAVVILRFVQDSSLAAIAEALDCPLGTVKSRLHNALRLLRDDLHHEFELALEPDLRPSLAGIPGGSEGPAS